jgi:ATP-dependent RNA helicase DHX37/DHR1
LKRTPEDYLQETFKVVCKIHSKLPNGGILVFLTGKKEINEMCEKLREEFNNNLNITKEEEKSKETSDPQNNEDTNKKEYELDNVENSNNMEDSDSEDQWGNEEKNDIKQYSEAIILPLYSSLSQEEQNRVFQKDVGNKRLIVISTNVAETSLTIPNIKYVVDCGKEKKRVFYIIN